MSETLLKTIRLSDLAEMIPWTGKSLRNYVSEGVLPAEKRGRTLHVNRELAARIVDRKAQHSNLRELITDCKTMENDTELLDLDVGELADDLGVSEHRVECFLNEHPDTPAAIGGKVSISAENFADMKNTLGGRRAE